MKADVIPLPVHPTPEEIRRQRIAQFREHDARRWPTPEEVEARKRQQQSVHAALAAEASKAQRAPRFV